MADFKKIQKKLSALKLIQKADNSIDTSVVTDKLVHFDKLERVEKDFVKKNGSGSGKAYKKFVQVRKDGDKHPKNMGKVKEEPVKSKIKNEASGGEEPLKIQKNGQWVEQEFKNGSWQDKAPNPEPASGGPDQVKPNPKKPKQKQPNYQGREPVQELKERQKRAGNGQARGADIRNRIATDADFAMENMLLMQEFQTKDEREQYKGTKYKNNVGFNKPDAEYFSEIMDQIKNHGGLKRFQQALGSAGWGEVERQVQGRMMKYGNQLADIANDNNRWRNFKTLSDQFKEAKGITESKYNGYASAMRGIDPYNGQAEKAMIGSGAKAINNDQIGQIFQERMRGPKQKADGIAKRFDNAKHAAEVYYQMREIGNNPNPHIQNIMDDYYMARVNQLKRGDNLDKLMENGFGALNMKQKNQLKTMMKELAPQIADVFNAYKEFGQAMPRGQEFRGKGLKQIQQENVMAKNPEPAQPVDSVKSRPNAVQGSASVGGAGEGGAGQFGILNDKLAKIDDQFGKTVPTDAVNVSDLGDTNGGVNGTYKYGEGNGMGFYKPGAAERFPRSSYEGNLRQHIEPGTYYQREITGYEAANEMGLEGLVPPTKLQTAKIDGDLTYLTKLRNGVDKKRNGSEPFKGSFQMNAVNFAEKGLGLRGVAEAGAARENLFTSKTENLHNMLVFDFVHGNTDRHAGNWFYGRKGDKIQAVAIDNGLALPTKKEVDRDQFNTKDSQCKAMDGGVGGKSVDKKFGNYIMNFDSKAEHSLRTRLTQTSGIKKSAIDGMVGRIKDLKAFVKSKGETAPTLSHVVELIETKYNHRVAYRSGRDRAVKGY